MKSFAIALSIAFLVSLAAPPLFAQESEAAATETPTATETPAVSVDDLAWLTGDWIGEMGGNVLEESWSPVRGGSMMGMFRWFRDGKPWLYELLAIETTAEGPVLYLKHFGPGLVGWEEKDEALTLHLESLGEKEVLFDNHDDTDRTRLRFRQPGPDVLEVVLEKVKGGETKASTFTYRRR